MAIERIVPGTAEWEAYYGDHIARYQFALEKLDTGKYNNILDAACGVGYGSHHLSKLPGVQVTAVDRSDGALAEASKHFKNEHTRFLKDDCHTLANASAFGPFDAIVSFETLEHLPDPKSFLKKSFDILSPSGAFIVSTPNQLVSSPGNNLNWEFHEKEYTPTELVDILRDTGFRDVQLYGQRLSFKGKLKNEIRADINSLWSNPFVRFGRWIQEKTRGRSITATLKQNIDDFEIVAFSPEECEKLLVNGPFVLIALASK